MDINIDKERELFIKLRSMLMDRVLRPAIAEIQKTFRDFLEENLEETENGFHGEQVLLQFSKMENIMPELLVSLAMSSLVTLQEPMLTPEDRAAYRRGDIDSTPFYQDTKKLTTRILTLAIQLMGALDSPGVETKASFMSNKQKPTVV